MEMEPLSVSGPGTWVSPEAGVALSTHVIVEVVAWCVNNLTEAPSMLLTRSGDACDDACRLIHVGLSAEWRESMPQFSVIGVNGLPSGTWIICGPSGGVICGGA